MKHAGESTAQYLGDIFRTIDCMVVRRGHYVDVNYRPESATASFSGLVTCGSVWACPNCAAKIQARRRDEIEIGISAMQAQGFVPIMVTLTFPHYVFHRLRDLIERQAEAFKLLRKGRQWDELRSGIGYGGMIRSLEVTHGGNGWHPHTHELWFVRGDVCELSLKARISHLWAKACHRAGLLASADIHDEPAFFMRSVDVRVNVDSGDYLAKQDDSRKWGMADEIAKATSKNGRATGVHPHHFLIRQEPGDDALYVEYVKGMKGRNQLLWSPGLKARCGVDDVSDEVLADEPERGTVLLAQLSAEAWKYVVGNDAHAELLDAAEDGGFDAVCFLLLSLGCPSNELPSPRAIAA